MLHTATAGITRNHADIRFRLAIRRQEAMQYLGDGIKAGWVVLMGIALIWLLLSATSARAAGLLIADNGLGGVLEIEEHEARVTINNGVAITEVTQVFRNTENRQVEALYTFPVPKAASVANFSMWINGKEMTGEVLEKKRAREIYNTYKQQRRDPGLLEQTDYKTFEMRIFPIGPNAAQKVRIVIYQELDFDHDWGAYVYPLATVARKNIDQRVKGKFTFNLDVKSEIPIVKMESPSHSSKIAVAPHSENYYQASLEAVGGDLSRDLVVAYNISRPRTGIDMIVSKQSREDGYFRLTLTAGEELKAIGGGAGKDYLFILDVSGSMDRDGKLQTSRNSVGAFIKALGKEDRFEVMTFNIQPAMLFSQLAAVSEDNSKRALEFLDSQQARGGTLLKPALEAAWRYGEKDREMIVVILSDGMSEPQERVALLEMAKKKPAYSRIFCIGIGNEVNRPLLQQLAEDAGGLAAFISQGDDFGRQAAALRRKLMRPVAGNLNLKFEGIEVYDLEPQTMPNLFYGAPVSVYGRYKRDGKATVTLQGTIGGNTLNKALELQFPASDAANPEIERMWAWNKTQRLLKEADKTGSRDSVIDEIVRLGEGYSIVTEYTSFLVLENDAEYSRWKIERRNALRVERDRTAQDRLRKQFEEMRMKALANLGPAPRPVGAAAKDGQRLAMANPLNAPEIITSDIPMPQGVPTAPNPQNTSSQNPNAQPQSAPNPPAPAPASRPSRGVNIDLPSFGGGGGGAPDPLSALLALILGGAGWMNLRRKRQN
ncbi:MAG: VIT and VWA domain-containing protein [Candidatus Sumerlaeota bacterium]|nr:VIT and VWA domain-containing protein [Candidatus Sumerlaeota bacterium]